MNKVNIKRFLIIGLLLFCNLFLIYRYLSLNKKIEDYYGTPEFGLTKHAIDKLRYEANDALQKSLKLEFWVLVFFFVFVAYSLYVLIKIKLSYNDKKRIESRIAFTDLDLTDQQKLLSNIHCKNCGEKKKMTFKEEKMLLGKMYLIVVCPTCNTACKVRLTSN